jgi:hypothetical protein
MYVVQDMIQEHCLLIAVNVISIFAKVVLKYPSILKKICIMIIYKYFISVHEHNLAFKMPRGGWSCDICKASYPYRSYSYRCDTCNWDQCFKCRFKK